MSGPATPYDRVMRHVRLTRGGHLLWTGYLTNGCPMIRTGPRKPNGAREKSESCRRIVWEHHHGEQPKWTQVRSTCGRSACLAVEHMAIDLPVDQAAVAARQQARAQQFAEWAQRRAAIVADYDAGMPGVEIAAKYGVRSPATIYRILRREGREPNRGGGRYDRAAATARRGAATGTPTGAIGVCSRPAE